MLVLIQHEASSFPHMIQPSPKLGGIVRTDVNLQHSSPPHHPAAPGLLVESSGGYLLPRETSLIHVLDLVRGRSRVNDKTLEDLWHYMAARTDILTWHARIVLA